MTYEQFVKNQQHALMREFIDDPGQSWIAVPSLEAFRKRHHGAGSWQGLPGVPTADAVIYRGPMGLELWVRPVDKTTQGDSGYRGHWAKFLAVSGGGEVKSRVNGRAMVIDHLHPETAATRHGFGKGYVRMMAVEARGNATVGSTVEKRLASREIPSKSYLSDWFTIAKVSGFRSSFKDGVPPKEVMSALLRHLRNLGYELPAGQAPDAPATMEAILKWSRGVPTNRGVPVEP